MPATWRYRCERLPLKIRLYAAAKACDFEPAIPSEAQQAAEADDAGRFLEEELTRRHRERQRRQHELLRSLVESGDLSEEGAIKLGLLPLAERSSAAAAVRLISPVWYF